MDKIAALDQLQAASRQLADTAITMLNEFTRAGFERAEAMALTMVLFESFVEAAVFAEADDA